MAPVKPAPPSHCTTTPVTLCHALLPGIYQNTALSTLSILRQSIVFVGPHGAGLTSMIFLPPGAAVVEFVPMSCIGEFVNRCEYVFYSRMANFSGLDYFPVPAVGDWASTLSVNVTEVLTAVNHAVQSRA